MQAGYLLFILASASHGLKAEAALKAAAIPCALIPVPRTLSSQCGVCLRVPGDHRQEAEMVLAECGVEVSATHEMSTTV
jgi:hypothetical protein